MAFFTQLDWVAIGMFIAIAAVHPFGEVDWHDKYDELKKHKERLEEKLKKWSWFIFPPSYVYFFVWFFVDALLVTGIYVSWRLIPTGNNYSVVILVLWFSLILAMDITSYLFFKLGEHHSHWAIITAVYCFSVGVVLTVLSAVQAHRLDDVYIYISTAMFGTYVVWTFYNVGMIWIASGYKEILKKFWIFPYKRMKGEEGKGLMKSEKNAFGMKRGMKHV